MLPDNQLTLYVSPPGNDAWSGALAEPNGGGLILAAVLLAAVSACATSVWALSGAGIKSRLHDPRFTRWVSVCLAGLLVYAAVDLAGLLPAVR